MAQATAVRMLRSRKPTSSTGQGRFQASRARSHAQVGSSAGSCVAVTGLHASWPGMHSHLWLCVAPCPTFIADDDDLRRGVAKLYAQLRHRHAEQQQQEAARTAGMNAAQLRSHLAAQVEALQSALQGTLAAELIGRLGGLPVASERGTGAAGFSQARSEAADWQQLLGQRRAASDSSGPAGSCCSAGSSAGAVGTAEPGQALEGASELRSLRPVPPQQLAATKSALNYVGGKGVPLQVGVQTRPHNGAFVLFSVFSEDCA